MLQDADLSRNMPGKVKVSAPNLLAAKKKWRMNTDRTRKSTVGLCQRLLIFQQLQMKIWSPVWTTVILNIDCILFTICLKLICKLKAEQNTSWHVFIVSTNKQYALYSTLKEHQGNIVQTKQIQTNPYWQEAFQCSIALQSTIFSVIEWIKLKCYRSHSLKATFKAKNPTSTHKYIN